MQQESVFPISTTVPPTFGPTDGSQEEVEPDPFLRGLMEEIEAAVAESPARGVPPLSALPPPSNSSEAVRGGDRHAEPGIRARFGFD